MSYFNRSDVGLEDEVRASPPMRSRFGDLAGRVGDWFAGIDHGASGSDADSDPLDQFAADLGRTQRRAVDSTSNGGAPDAAEPIRRPGVAPDAAEPIRRPGGARAQAEPTEADLAGAQFPVAPFGYSRAAVDQRLGELESELAALRSREQPQPQAQPSITDEIERIGEQTASILVVAHDQAHETTRRAQEQADRCIADAAANAVAITADAKRRLEELDAETEAVWRERERLLEDVRAVSAALTTLAAEASERFPAAEPRGMDSQPTAFG
jgi:hypothetical protein